jgi:hypothetical protein
MSEATSLQELFERFRQECLSHLSDEEAEEFISKYLFFLSKA